MEETKKLPVKVSEIFIADLDIIFKYGIETFDTRQAGIFEDEIWKLGKGLSNNWPLFSE